MKLSTSSFGRHRLVIGATKKIILLSFVCFCMHITFSVQAQDNVGIGTNTPNASAILEMLSTNKGLLIPRMSTAGMTAIPTPANSLLVYNTDSMCYFFYRQPALTWVSLCNAESGGNNSSDTIYTNYSYIDSLFANYGNVDSLFANYANIDSLIANYINVNNIFANYGNFDTLVANYLNADSIFANYANIDSLIANHINVNNIFANYGNFDTLVANYINVDSIFANYGNFDTLIANYINVDSIFANYGNFDSLVVNGVSIQSLVDSLINASDADSICSAAATNYVTKFTSPTEICNSIIYDNGTNVGISTATPTTTALLTITPTTNAVRNGIDMTLSGATSTATGLNISTGNVNVNGITVTHSSSSLTSSLYGIGSVLSSANIVSGYNGYRNGSGLSYGIYGINGTNATYATNSSTWAAFLQGRTVISSESSPSSGLGTDLEIRNTTTGASNPSTVSLRQTVSNTTNGIVLANLNFGDNHQTGPQAQIQVTRGAAGGAGDLPTDMIFYTTPDASATLTERMRIMNNGNVGIGTTNPSVKLEIVSGLNTEFIRLNNGTTPPFRILFGNNIGGESNAVGVVYYEIAGDESHVFGGHVMPDSDGARFCGTPSHRWQEVWAANGTIQTSDEKEKENISSLKYGLKEITQLNPITFRWKKIVNYNALKIGLSAQELEKIIPEVVIRDKEHPEASLGVIYSDLIPVLINAIKEQQKIIDNQQSVISTIQSENVTILNEIKDLKTDIKKIKIQLDMEAKK